MNRTLLWLTAVAGSLPILASCVAPEQAMMMERDIRKLQTEISALREFSERMPGGSVALLQEVKGLRADLERLRRIQADLEARLQATLRSAAMATGELEKAQFLAGKASREIAELQKRLEEDVRALRKGLARVENHLGLGEP